MLKSKSRKFKVIVHYQYQVKGTDEWVSYMREQKTVSMGISAGTLNILMTESDFNGVNNHRILILPQFEIKKEKQTK